MSAAVSLASAAPVYTSRHGDRKFRIRPIALVPDWRLYRIPLPSVGEARAFAAYVRRSLRETGLMLPCSAEAALRIVLAVEALDAAEAKPTREDAAPWMAPPKRAVHTRWVVHACALQRYAEGRGPYPLPPPSKKYEPVPIVWAELPPELRRAFERVAEAVSWSRALGEEGQERLVRLNQRYKRWARGRMHVTKVVAEAEAFVAFVEAAPIPRAFVVPAPATDPADKIDAEELLRAVRRLVALAPGHLRERLEYQATTEALLGAFEPTDSIETRAKRAIWRVEARVRRESQRSAKNSCRRNGRFESEPF